MNTLTIDTYDKTVKEASLPLVLDFWADWCQPCLKLNTILPTVEKLLEGVADIYKVNIEEGNNRDLVNKFGIQSIPTFVVLQKGTGELLLKVGAQGSAKDIADMLQWSITKEA